MLSMLLIITFLMMLTHLRRQLFATQKTLTATIRKLDYVIEQSDFDLSTHRAMEAIAILHQAGEHEEARMLSAQLVDRGTPTNRQAQHAEARGA